MSEQATMCCPECDSDDVGSADVVLVTAHGHWRRSAITGKVEFDGDGTSKVHWDGQVPADKANPCWCRDCEWQGPPDKLIHGARVELANALREADWPSIADDVRAGDSLWAISNRIGELSLEPDERRAVLALLDAAKAKGAS